MDLSPNAHTHTHTENVGTKRSNTAEAPVRQNN